MDAQETNSPPAIDVAYVAHLARLQLTDGEVRTFQSQLEQVVEYVRQIRGLNLDAIEPTSHAHPVVNVLRADEARPGLDREKVLRNAPAVIQDQFMVPRIVE
jgi:aspartyl-tRNA(Asn)/glutamyl-tRNA(Gln) amidotransferase subunit C